MRWQAQELYEAIYIGITNKNFILKNFRVDCDGGFNYDRIKEIFDSSAAGSRSFSKIKVTWVECMERLYIQRIFDVKDLEEYLNAMYNFLKETNKVFFE